MTRRTIETDADLVEGAAYLADIEPRFADVLPEVTPLPLRRKPEGFSEVLAAIMGQQVSTASAQAICQRLADARLDQAAAVQNATEEDLRACGLSRQKIRYAHALAEADIDYAALRGMSDAAVLETLTAVTGVGVWTAEIYLKFSLGRADAFAAGDLALQIAAQDLFDLADRPTPSALRALAEPWSPWRSVAARILWAYYRVRKQRDGIR
ncbi:MAG: DNA-3-methyladenine glycosylase 2 family protein [Pseudomonadota bacterium]